MIAHGYGHIMTFSLMDYSLKQVSCCVGKQHILTGDKKLRVEKVISIVNSAYSAKGYLKT